MTKSMPPRHFSPKRNPELTPFDQREQPARPVLDLTGFEDPKVPSYQPSGKPNGVLTVTIFGKDVTITGGPYRACPADMFGIKMAKEIRSPHVEIDIPTVDFSLPPAGMVEPAVERVFFDAFKYPDARWYVGCMAGRGRTGLFLAGMAYLAGIDDPVAYVRTHYYSHACETKEQEEFALGLDRKAFRKGLMRQLVKASAINFTDLRAMSWADRWLWTKTRFSF